ncbi:MAG: Signal peptidase I [Microgenomates group bacterium GW2011_GWC1_43_11]|uniref:Signal peptidase I n=2 Tax=Candidatus Gottesmaniibacteriota TaxID=1752720 RepID=A0A0G1IPL4_9BACT|nr:MAG: Signal peptidase I [Microgenomates group bacterium GW2011_GWC1_43_11]KKT36994.1 MAG: Signal peptidase I [Candidatus Gottesmanbacteria bacterium GW2011_GWB1_44_11c]KKT60908.1 MAG: Signal peptidase I [Candidatus Gottesmanbacteria bacterium GW2011_GWA1_44_24b]HCM82508.1 signal peptidase I [Patescibacteria group bacterium]
MDSLKRAVAAIFDFLQGIVVFLAIIVMVYLFLFSPQEINGQSMEPTFFNTELIITNKFIYKINPPQRGDVVIFKSPRNKEVDYIKRVIGLPGDTVKLVNNIYYVNGVKLDEPYLRPNTQTSGGSYLREGEEAIIPEGQYFVSGDNRPHSSDSRDFGPVPLEDFIGKGILLYWPVSRLSPIEKPQYAI